MKSFSYKTIALAGAFFAAAGVALAQDSGPLVDLLVQKGIVTDQEAEELKVELVKSFVSNSAAGKLDMSSSLTSFKLSGDVRLRHQMETKSSQSKPDVSDERTRERFRFRFNGDAKLAKGWGAGFALETGSAADSGNQTLENGSDDYGISLARAYVSYQATENLFLTGGKFKNPLYTTDMVWDSDINPQGLSESYTMALGGGSTLVFNLGQFVMDDNKESVGGASGRDAIMFAQQAVFTTKIGGNKFVIAPGFMTYNASTVSGLTNETSFSGSTKYLKVFTMPGEYGISDIAGEGTKLKLYWDLAYNFDADERVHGIYGVASTLKEDATAWLFGVGYAKGKGKSQGDYSVKLDYREVGVGSLDPNISDSDFAFGNFNQKGFKLGASYNVTDFASLGATYFYTTDKQSTLNHSVAGLDHSQILQLDLVVKF